MTVSIILPNYNHALYLETSLNAILMQTKAPDEVIIIDDCSTDNSLEEIAKFERKHNIIKVLKNEHNIGPTRSVNRGFLEARGKYVAFCSADDYLEPNFLEVLVNCLEKDPSLALCTSDFCTFENSEAGIKERITLLEGKKQKKVMPNELADQVRKYFFWIPTNTSVYRKKVLSKLPFLNDDLKWMSDWFLNYQIAYAHPVAYIPQRLSAFRQQASSYCRSYKNRSEAFKKLFELLQTQDSGFQDFFKKSGVLYQQGRSAFKYLLAHPKKWTFMPQVLKNIIRFKLSKRNV